jgi:hypothetical protein
MRSLSFIVAVGMLSLVARPASAQTPTTYSYQYVADQTAYTVPTSSDVTIHLYLKETNSDQSTHSLLVNEHGLSAAGVDVTFTAGDSSATITGASFNGGTVPAGFDAAGNTATFTATDASISESTDPAPFGTDLVGVAAGPQTNGVSQVLLGTITIHTGATGGVSSTFTVATTDAEVGATFTNDNGYDLDNTAYPFNPAGAAALYSDAQPGAFTVTTSATPEPASLSVIFLLCLSMSRTIHRRV